MLGVYLGGWEVYSGVFITQVLCKRCQAVEGRKQRMVPEHFLFLFLFVPCTGRG